MNKEILIDNIKAANKDIPCDSYRIINAYS